MRAVFALALCLLLPAGGAWAQAKSADTVTVYRCTDAAGKQSLRDSPCPKGQKQQAREMRRPQDGPKAAVRAAPAAAPTAAPMAEVPVYRAPPLPMYQCTTPDGERYTSDTGDGNPRWVPYWTLGYGYPRRHGGNDAGRGDFRRAPPLGAGVSIPRTPPLPTPAPPVHRHPLPWPVASGGGQWIADACVLLPPSETCAVLRDRRDAIRTRFFNAQEKERDTLRIEERAINARLANDCGGG